jgi:ATP-dependent exoDNAse (exonuclease V) alpha subunit
MRQAQALQVMLEGDSVFLTGAPGAGKTYVLNQFIGRARKQGKTVAVTASTGIAATHIGGTTIHSWSGLGIRDSLREWDRDWLRSNARLKKRYYATDVLVIDEISMLHGARLDMVNEACKILRESDDPFGGLQVILVGDLFQLPPVTRGSDRLDFAHTSAAWQELDPRICYITEQHRQSGDALLALLEAMRAGQLEDVHVEALQERLGQRPAEGVAVTRLYAHNIDVESINTRHLAQIPIDAKIYEMQTKGTAAKVEQLIKSVLAPERLELKVGAEVMFVANNFAAGFVNGSRGKVTAFFDGLPMVEIYASGKEVRVEPHSWSLVEDNRKRAEVAQLPLRLAWAITIHKSQGMSLDAAEIDLSKTFTPGMGYVALSRVRSLGGIYLSGVNDMALQLHPNIFDFDRALQRSSHELAQDVSDAPEESIASTEHDEVQAVEYDEALFDELRRWRLERARVERIAPFMVLHDATLQELARRKPTTPQKLLATKGFGPMKAEKFGSEVLEIIAGTEEKTPGDWNPTKDAELLRLFYEGTSLDEVAAQFDSTPQEVWARLSDLLKD